MATFTQSSTPFFPALGAVLSSLTGLPFPAAASSVHEISEKGVEDCPVCEGTGRVGAPGPCAHCGLRGCGAELCDVCEWGLARWTVASSREALARLEIEGLWPAEWSDSDRAPGWDHFTHYEHSEIVTRYVGGGGSRTLDVTLPGGDTYTFASSEKEDLEMNAAEWREKTLERILFSVPHPVSYGALVAVAAVGVPTLRLVEALGREFCARSGLSYEGFCWRAPFSSPRWVAKEWPRSAADLELKRLGFSFSYHPALRRILYNPPALKVAHE
jgi:hypothetical protein